jgi:hypothetical protein
MNRTRKSPNNELQMAYCGDKDTAGRGISNLTQWFNCILQKLCFKTSWDNILNQLDLGIKVLLKNI